MKQQSGKIITYNLVQSEFTIILANSKIIKTNIIHGAFSVLISKKIEDIRFIVYLSDLDGNFDEYSFYNLNYISIDGSFFGGRHLSYNHSFLIDTNLKTYGG